MLFQIKYKETYMKDKEKAVGINTSDSRTLHSLQVGKISSDVSRMCLDISNTRPLKKWLLHKLAALPLLSPLKVEYKKGSKESQAKYSLPVDMFNLSHAKKAQALASDLEYRTKLHDYTAMADDIKVQQAKKAYSLQSEVRAKRR